MGRVVSIVYTPRDVEWRRPPNHYARVRADRVTLVESRGIDGDAKGGGTRKRRKPSNASLIRRRRSRRYGQLKIQ